MKKINIIHVVGARPNFIKLAPVYAALIAYPEFSQIIIHTGQHYDYNMSDIFFKEFGIPEPQVNLSISGKSILEQIGLGIIKLGEELPKTNPNLVIIYGDVNATAYTSVVCSKLGIKLAHIEAGLRSFDRSMPEETNRIIADSLTDYFFTTSKDADENLLKNGIDKSKIFLVGNVMIDTLIKFLPQAETVSLPFEIPATYGLVTLHRPSNVDDENNLSDILETLEEISEKNPLIFPMHPRTRSKVPKKFAGSTSSILFTNPLGYLPFLKLQKEAKFIITDSGGIQEESTYLGVPCFTLRNNTERPITVEVGTNTLVGTDLKILKSLINRFFEGYIKKASIPFLWDGKSSERIARILYGILIEHKIYDEIF